MINMNYFLRTVSHEKRVQWSIVLIFLSNVILAFAFSIWVTTDSRSQYYLNLVAFFLVSAGAGLSDATIVGYFKCFHKDLVEPWGTGTAIAGFFNVFSNFYTTNYDMDQKLAWGYLITAFVSSIPFLLCFRRMNAIRLEAQGIKIRRSIRSSAEKQSKSHILSTSIHTPNLALAKKDYALYQNQQFTWKNNLQVFSKISSEMRNMFVLQFLNDIAVNLCLLIDVSRLETQEAKLFNSQLGKNGDLNKSSIIQGLSNNQYSVILLGFAIGNYCARSSLYEYLQNRNLSITAI